MEMITSQETSKYKILLIDDDEDIVEFVSYNLKKEGYQVFTSTNPAKGIEIAKSEKPQLIILDVMMPDIDGIEVCREIRSNKELKDVMIAFLTARSEDYSQIAGFDVGADDYIHKPIKPRVLVSRIKALLKRYSGNIQEKGIAIGDIVIDREKYLVTKAGQEFNFPKKEFELLALLASTPGKVFTRESILDKVWGDEVVVGDRTIDVHIRKLREKLGDECIKTIKGIGYKFES